MVNKVGEHIYNLRKQYNYTQQQLSEILGVSISAVSKWETGSAHPDIELLPNLASIFDVSIDYFFDYHLNSKENPSTILEKAEELNEAKDFSTTISMLKKTLLKYPNDILLKFKLAETRIFLGLMPPSDSEKIKHLTEANKELLEVITRSTNRELIDESYYLLGMSYINLREFDKAEEMINQLNQTIHMKTELALMRLYLEKGDTNNAIRQFQCNLFFSMVQIHTNSLWIDKLFKDDLEKSIIFFDLAIHVFEAFSYDYSCRFDVHISQFYERIALAYIKTENFEKAITSLKSALTYAQSYDKLEPSHDLALFDKLTKDDTRWDRVNNRTLQLWNDIESKISNDYKSIRDHVDFINFINEFKQCLF